MPSEHVTWFEFTEGRRSKKNPSSAKAGLRLSRVPTADRHPGRAKSEAWVKRERMGPGGAHLKDDHGSSMFMQNQTSPEVPYSVTSSEERYGRTGQNRDHRPKSSTVSQLSTTDSRHPCRDCSVLYLHYTCDFSVSHHCGWGFQYPLGKSGRPSHCQV